MLNMLLNILTNTSQINNLELSQIMKKMIVRLKQKVSSSKIEELTKKFDIEKELIRNEMKTIDRKDFSFQYEDLKAKLNELKDEEESQIKQIEDRSKDYETRIQLEIDQDESRLQALREDTKALKEANEKNIQQEFGYFKGGR